MKLFCTSRSSLAFPQQILCLNSVLVFRFQPWKVTISLAGMYAVRVSPLRCWPAFRIRPPVWRIWELPCPQNSCGDPNYLTLEEGILANLEYAKTFGEACKEHSDEFLPYFDTPNNAKDLYKYTIMEATGARTVMAFWGYRKSWVDRQ